VRSAAIDAKRRSERRANCIADQPAESVEIEDEINAFAGVELAMLLDKLPSRLAEALTMFAEHGTFADAARALGVSADIAQRRVRQARVAIRAMYEDDAKAA
jgi:DNA-directed RNA polymerase specialized sigma24 family protein